MAPRLRQAMSRLALAAFPAGVALLLHGCGERNWDPVVGIINSTDGEASKCGRNGERCKCPEGHSVVGDDVACGDGSSQYFDPDEIAGKDCSCQRNVLECPEVTTQANFDLEAYIAKPWFIQQQMETEYLRKEYNWCVNAKYTMRPKKSFWGYTISVRNRAYTESGELLDSGDGFLSAYGYDKSDASKLAVAPWFVPKSFSGEYWVLAHNEMEGYALISGGQPKMKTPRGCRTGSGTNEAGLWIFTRHPQPNASTIEKVRGIAAAQGFDLSVLNDVNHESCTGRPNYEEFP